VERIRVERRPVKRKIRPEVLPLDPRDPDIVRAKELVASERRRRQAA
jgi:hypothetical protein